VRVRDVMDRRAARVRVSDSLRVGAELLVLTASSDIVVVDDENRFVGVLSEGDVLRALMPDFTGLAEARATIEDAYAIFLESGAKRAEEPVSRLTIRESITVGPDDELLTPAAVMITKNIRRLPVVEDGRFLGSISRADICWALMSDLPAPAPATAPEAAAPEAAAAASAG
jgi:CBS domain-containing protein